MLDRQLFTQSYRQVDSRQSTSGLCLRMSGSVRLVRECCFGWRFTSIFLCCCLLGVVASCAVPRVHCGIPAQSFVISAALDDSIAATDGRFSPQFPVRRPEELERFWVRSTATTAHASPSCVLVEVAWLSRPEQAVFSFSSVAFDGRGLMHRLFASVEPPPRPRCRDWPRAPRWWFRVDSWVRSSTSGDGAFAVWSERYSGFSSVQQYSEERSSALVELGPHSLRFFPAFVLRTQRWDVDFGEWFFSRAACASGGRTR